MKASVARSDLLQAWCWIVIGTVSLALLNTLGDWIWAVYIPRGRMVHGVVHGAVLCMALGIVLGLAAKASGQAPEGTNSVLRGLVGQLLIGLVVSAGFYPLYGLIGWAAMVTNWMLLWILTGWLQRWLTGNRESLQRALLRGLLAAILSGIAFYAISDIWTTASDRGYLYFLACWLFAFFPGFLALLHPWPGTARS